MMKDNDFYRDTQEDCQFVPAFIPIYAYDDMESIYSTTSYNCIYLIP